MKMKLKHALPLALLANLTTLVLAFGIMLSYMPWYVVGLVFILQNVTFVAAPVRK